MCIHVLLKQETSSGSDTTSHVIPAVADVNAIYPECALPGLTSTNNSSKKRKSRDDFPTSIKNDIDGTMKSLANPSTVRDKFSAFGEMISDELKYLSRSQQIY